MRKLILGLTFLAACLSLGVSTAEAASTICACCIERGYYEVGRERPDASTLGIIGDLNFAPKATLYMTAAGYDGIVGLPGIETEVAGDENVAFDIVDSFLKKTWKLAMKTPSGKTGELTLPMPILMTRMKIDTREGEDTGLGVSAYKEFSFSGKVSGATGIFKSAVARPTTYHLAFQGRGNGCDSSSDFSYWRLSLKGPRTGWVMLGNLSDAEDLTEKK